MEIILNILRESWQFLLMSSPYLLLGLVVSGIIRSFLSPEIIARYLGSNSIKSVLYAALFGVPLPLCSCGVVPTAIALRKQGASRGAVLAFLISTPESGVDSIAMTYALIDPIMAVTRPIAAFMSGITAGILDIFFGTKTEEVTATPQCPKCVDTPMTQHLPHTLSKRLKEGFQFSFVTLLNDIGGWFLLGVALAGVIGALVPQTLIENYLGGGFASMMIILAISIPLYICAAGSTPIAAALMLKGMSPGAALVLLMAGPATNAASLAVLSRFLGMRSTIIYVGTIAVMSVAFGYALDAVYSLLHITPSTAHHVMDHDMGGWWYLPCTIILLAAMGVAKRKTISSVLILVLCMACGSSTPSTASSSSSSSCSNAALTEHSYLMSFHSCDTATDTCSSPSNHTVRLAGSNDGITWTLISQFSSYAGSVPDVFSDGTYLYIFTADHKVRKYDAALCLLSTTDVTLSGSDSDGYVDPSLIQDGSDTYLFYLPGVIGADPAGCSSYPCTKEIHSALASSDFATMTQQSGARVSEELSAGALSDPDILKFGSTYLLYVSSGQSTNVYTSSSLNGTYTSPDGATPRTISNNSGGVPTAIVGSDNQVWLYVTTSTSGIEVIRRATSANGTTAISDSSFSTVVSSSLSSDWAATVSVSSPSVITWPAGW